MYLTSLEIAILTPIAAEEKSIKIFIQATDFRADKNFSNDQNRRGAGEILAGEDFPCFTIDFPQIYQLFLKVKNTNCCGFEEIKASI